MKRLHYILLTALLMLTACSAKEEFDTLPAEPEVSTMGGVVGGAVKTQFTFSIPSLYTAKTRLGAAEVMNENTNFTGLQDIRIFPFLATSTDAEGEYTVTGTTAFSGFTGVSQLPDNCIPGFDASALLHREHANDKWYADLQIPAGINALLIYGKRLSADLSRTDASFSMSSPDDTPQGTISFAHTHIYNNVEDLQTQPEAQLLVALLNQVLAAKGYETADGALEAWSNGDNLLTETYDDFKTLRAGSSLHIRKALETLYNACAQTTALDILTAPAGQQTLPEAIQTAITTKVTVGGRSIQLIATVPVGSPTGTLAWSTTDGCEAPAFPTAFGLPDGSVSLTYTPSATLGQPGTFAYSTDPTHYGTYAMDYKKIVSPADLWYLSNTAIRTSEQEQNENVGTQTWQQFISAYYDPASRDVTPTTKSIAAMKALQFSVGRLDSYAHIVQGTIYARDPKSPTDDSKQQAVAVPAEGFRITGILVGGQPDRVGWDFRPSSLTMPVDASQTIYDNVMTAMDGSTSNTYVRQLAMEPENPFTRTLLFETPGVPNPASAVTAGTNDEVVNIAIELENNSTQPFYGEDGIIPVGGRFYLISAIRLSDKAAEANSRGIKSIFMRDFITVVNITIRSLKHAYNTIPNLTVPSQELGVSIDLQWKEGPIIETTIK